jgi:protein-disulfide isomerase/uncharacterized membrane protein
MAKKRQNKQSPAKSDPAASPSAAVEERAARLRKLLLLPMLALMGTALVANGVLQSLYMQVQRVGAGKVDSFCAINESFNCVTVAASEWATIAGIPVSLYGLEYFGLIVLGMLLSAVGLWRVRRWDSLLFVALLAALPVSLTMAAIAVFLIKSVCIMCSLIYGANILGLAIMLVAYRGQLGDLVSDGPRELLSSGGATRGAIVIVLALGVSQFFWVPALVGGNPKPTAESSQDMLAGVPTNGMLLGKKSASILIEEFTDFQCPHCSKAHATLLQLVKRMNGRVKVRHYDYPLDQACNRRIRRRFHPYACQAAFYARCASDQGKFWPYAATLMHNQSSLGEDDLQAYAKRVGLDVAKLTSCASRPSTRQKVLADIEAAIRRKVRGTPTFFINGEEILGPRPMGWWEKKIAAILRGRP